MVVFYAWTDIENGSGFLRLFGPGGDAAELKVHDDKLSITMSNATSTQLYPNISDGLAKPYLICDASSQNVLLNRYLKIQAGCMLESDNSNALLDLYTTSSQDHLSTLRLRTPNNGNDNAEILVGGNRGLMLRTFTST